jgi:hypothetical protein
MQEPFQTKPKKHNKTKKHGQTKSSSQRSKATCSHLVTHLLTSNLTGNPAIPGRRAGNLYNQLPAQLPVISE